MHDVRHAFASIGVQSGLSLSLIGGLLGHAQVATTQHYAYLAALPLYQAVAQIGEALVAALGPMYAPGGDQRSRASASAVVKRSSGNDIAIPSGASYPSTCTGRG